MVQLKGLGGIQFLIQFNPHQISPGYMVLPAVSLLLYTSLPQGVSAL